MSVEPVEKLHTTHRNDRIVTLEYATLDKYYDLFLNASRIHGRRRMRAEESEFVGFLCCRKII